MLGFLADLGLLILTVVAGLFLGCLLEALPWLRRLTQVRSLGLGRLPPVCTSAFLLALVSPRSANGLLAGELATGRLDRRQVLLTCLANTAPSSLIHLRSMVFTVVPLAGLTGLAYLGWQLLVALLVTELALLASRVLLPVSQPVARSATSPVPGSGSGGLWAGAWQRTRRVLPRLLLITVPLYAVVAYLEHCGLLQALSHLLPQSLQQRLPAQALTIIAAHLTNVVAAAALAGRFLASGVLDPTQVFLALVIGNAVSLPLRTLRHNLPATVGTFPPGLGLVITTLGQGLRLVLAVVTVILVLVLAPPRPPLPHPPAIQASP